MARLNRLALCGVTVLLFTAVAVQAQDVDSDDSDPCQSLNLQGATLYSISDIQSSYDANDVPASKAEAGASCLASTFEGRLVKTTGVVTAVGGVKDSYNPDYFWIQDGVADFSGIEIIYPEHTVSVSRGDLVEVVGVVQESPAGLTVIRSCLPPTVTSQSNPLPEPRVISSADFDEGMCSPTTEALEGMLVKIENPTVLECSNAHCSAGILSTDASSWDKYGQSWLSDGAGSLSVDNHIWTIYTTFIHTPGTQFTSVTGVLSWFMDTMDPPSDPSHWEIVVRDAADVVGGTDIPVDEVLTTTVAGIQQLTNQYGNSATTVPSKWLGKDIEGGSGIWEYGSCPDSTTQEWMSTDTGEDAGWAKGHQLCACYPPEGLTDLGSLQGEYVRVTGVVSMTEGPTRPFYFQEETCDDNGEVKAGMYVYRKGSPVLEPGDKIQIIAKPYAYYGSEQLSNPLDIKVLQKGVALCKPRSISAEDFHVNEGDNFCKLSAEQHEGTFVRVEYVKVVGFTKDESYPGVSTTYAPSGLPSATFQVQTFQNEGCQARNGDYIDGGCQFIVEDKDGYQMLIDNKLDGVVDYFSGDVAEYPGEVIKVGDTFTAITCIVNQHRGEYLGQGGHYDCNPSPGGMVGWNEEWPSSSDDGLDAGVIAGIAVAVAVFVAAVAYGLYITVGKTAAKKEAMEGAMEIEASKNPL